MARRTPRRINLRLPSEFGGLRTTFDALLRFLAEIDRDLDATIELDADRITTGTFADARISETSVTQHEGALEILESQIPDGAILARVGGNETITGDWTFQGVTVVPEATITAHEAALSIAGEQIDSGEIADARLSSNVPLLGAALNEFTGAMDVSGALTAASYGGIASANLLDKTDNETVSGNWNFKVTSVDDLRITRDGTAESGMAFYNASGARGFIDFNDAGTFEVRDGDTVGVFFSVTDSGDLTTDGDISGVTIGGITEANLLDKSASEIVIGAYLFDNALGITVSDSAGDYSSIRESGDSLFERSVKVIRTTGANFEVGAWGAALTGPPAAATFHALLGEFRGGAYDGVAWHNIAGRVQFRSTENWAPGAHGTNIGFWSTLNGASSATNRVLIQEHVDIVLDNSRLRFGVGKDLQLYSDGTDGHIVAPVLNLTADVNVTGALAASTYLQTGTTTTAALDDITNAVNTDPGKTQGATLFDATANRPVWAVGAADGDVWVDGTGATVNTPV